MFLLKNNPSFKLIIFNIVSVCICLSHSVRCNLRNTMPRGKPDGVIRQPFRSGNRGEDRIDFVRCVDGREPQIQELWSFVEDWITREVHTFACVDVGDFSKD